MKPRTIVLVTYTVACLLSPPAFGQSPGAWVEIRDSQELGALYSNKTFRGNGWVGHFRADGRGILVTQYGRTIPRTWEVKGNDQVCATPEGSVTRCFRYQRNRENPKQIMATDVKDGTILQ